MSGEAGGLIVIPIALAALPIVLGGLAIYGIARVTISASKAAAKYEQEQRTKRDIIRQSGVENTIGSFRSDIQRNMNEQQQQNIKVSESMMSELQTHRNSMISLASSSDPERYRDYVSALFP
jgi:hypothetical protein